MGTFGCDGARKRLGIDAECCASCHYEWEGGYGHECEIEDRDDVYFVCCLLAEPVRSATQGRDEED